MTTLIVASKCGQLGNRLVLGGHLVALAAEHRFRLLNIAFADYAQYFMGTVSSACCTFPERQRRVSIPQAREYAFRVSNVTARALRRLHVDNRITRTFVSWPYNAAEDLDSQPARPPRQNPGHLRLLSVGLAVSQLRVVPQAR